MKCQRWVLYTRMERRHCPLAEEDGDFIIQMLELETAAHLHLYYLCVGYAVCTVLCPAPGLPKARSKGTSCLAMLADRMM